MEKLNDKWLRIGGISILNLFLNIFFYLDLVHVKHIPFLKVFLLSTAYVIISWEVTRFVILLVRKKFPGILNTRKRIINLGIYVTAATLVISLLKVEFISGVDFYNMGELHQDHPMIFEYLYSFGMNMFYALIITCLLYTSDAADERSSVDLGGRRIIKKKNNNNNPNYSLVKQKK